MRAPQAYSVSKVAVNALIRVMVRAAADAAAEEGLSVSCHYYSCCPGWVRTDMGGGKAPKSTAEGADTPIWLSTSPLSGLVDGGFYAERRLQGPKY